ncbi:hypothetical protein EUGRSUZ_E02497 [Eucalyptus grandis]|uniref:Uncharacterized protein n=2 Tax=Eucalyptus grandis TaxID=71139 RepID=A0ACC3KWP2_EUCGR|nr:hypothetical protein EUGRSUZ_E02497 [Eucalyptus grandis]
MAEVSGIGCSVDVKMEHTVIINRSEILATLEEKLEWLKKRNVSTPDNQPPSGYIDLNKFMDPKLYKAAKSGDADKFVEALEADSRELALSLIFDQVTPSGNSLLHVAASSEKEDVIKLILSHFPHLVTWKNCLKDTPLHVAVQNENLHETAMQLLLEKDWGTPDQKIIYWKNKDGKSPLYLAAETGRLGILQLLLKASAQDGDYALKMQGMSPVLAALEEGKSDVLEAIIHQLPKLLHVCDEDGRTPLHHAASVGNVKAVKLLVEKCRYLALQTDKNGSYPIHIACENGHVDTIRELMNSWPDLAEMKNKKEQNILHVAAEGGKIKAVEYILENSAIEKLVNSKDADGNTALHLASMHSHCPVLLSLTKRSNLDLKLRNNDNLTALDVAMEPESLSPNDPALRGRAILAAFGVPQSKGRDVRSAKKQDSEASKSSRAKWINQEINARLVVATLVATVTFTAGFTLPGGINVSSDPHPGMATMLHKGLFQLFVICDAYAMYCSIGAVVVLLGGHVTDLQIAEEALVEAGGLLVDALLCMAVAFLAALIMAVNKVTWLMAVIVCIAVSRIIALWEFIIASMKQLVMYLVRIPGVPRPLRIRLLKVECFKFRH